VSSILYIFGLVPRRSGKSPAFSSHT